MSPALPDGVGFTFRDGQLFCEEVPLDALADRFGTPLFVYSRQAIVSAFDAYASALKGRAALVCYAMKANSNLAILDVLARRGAGFDIVSGGELARILAVGADPKRVVFSGVGKTEAEIEAGLDAGILCFNIESTSELDRIAAIAERKKVRARVSVRVNPDVDAGTHPYISTGLKENKFGVAYADTRALYRRAASHRAIDVVGIDCHIGSQITDIAPYVDTADRLLDLVDQLQADGIRLEHVDFGGGLGIRYDGESPPSAQALIGQLLARLDQRGHADKTVLFEPGRSIVGNAGVLLTRVEYLKDGETRNFAIVDAAMNDLVRPAMYDAWMGVVPVRPRSGPGTVYDVVGPICESGDWIARERRLDLQVGDLLAVTSAGAYGMTMSSNYNSRPRAAEVMVDGATPHLVRRRESVASLFADESTLR